MLDESVEIGDGDQYFKLTWQALFIFRNRANLDATYSRSKY